jgi:phosphoenolpyruvate carboxylase
MNCEGIYSFILRMRVREVSNNTHSPHRTKPTPIDEAKAGLAVVENVLWNAVPGYLRKLNDVSNQQLGIAFRCR